MNHFFATDDAASGLQQQLQQPILGQGQRGIEQAFAHQYLTRIRLQMQHRREGRLVEHQGRGLFSIHKRQLEAEGNLDFIAILQRGDAFQVAAVEVCAVLAAQIFHHEPIALAKDARVTP